MWKKTSCGKTKSKNVHATDQELLSHYNIKSDVTAPWNKYRYGFSVLWTKRLNNPLQRIIPLMDHSENSLCTYKCCLWRQKVENLGKDVVKKYGTKRLPHQNSSALAHLYTAYGRFCYFLDFFPFLHLSHLFFFFLKILGGMSPSLWKFMGAHPPASATCECCK